MLAFEIGLSICMHANSVAPSGHTILFRFLYRCAFNEGAYEVSLMLCVPTQMEGKIRTTCSIRNLTFPVSRYDLRETLFLNTSPSYQTSETGKRDTVGKQLC